MIEWLNDNSGAVQAIAVVVLAVVTTVYAIAAQRQADASGKMAEEMREARHAALLPVLDFGIEESGLEEVFAIKDGKFPEIVSTCIRNIGVGPALDAEFNVQPTGMSGYLKRMEYIAVGETKRRWPLLLRPVGEGTRLLEVEYRDVYGRKHTSQRRLIFDKASGGSELGPLEFDSWRLGGKEPAP
jgi:hypothetical protein